MPSELIVIQIRCTPEERDHWKDEAWKARLSLAAWIRGKCGMIDTRKPRAARKNPAIQEPPPKRGEVKDSDFADITVVDASAPPEITIQKNTKTVAAKVAPVWTCPICKSEFCPGCQPIRTK